ncbi:hypothetical protein IJS77_00325 [bacterium]|nr:hypothetical protein [bacterium]
MKVSFNGIYYYKYSNKAKRDEVKSLEDVSVDGKGKFWTMIPIDKDKNSSDLILLTGLDLEDAIDSKGKNQTLDEYVKENSDVFIQKAKIYDNR